MSLPINAKYEVPKHKAPPPTRTSLWPALTPGPVGPAAGRPNTPAKNFGEKSEAGRPARPITPGKLMSLKATDGRPLGRGKSHGRNLLMKLAIPVIPVLALAALLGVGCSNEKPKAQPTSALDVAGQRPVANAPAAYQPAANTPSYVPSAQPQPVVVEPVAADPAPAAPAKTAGDKQSYVVQKGDTLFKIAKTQYGDGNKWQKIAAANPGLSPSTLKIGQKIVLPTL
jgi:nucleoid-associated protein YgaU